MLQLCLPILTEIGFYAIQYYRNLHCPFNLPVQQVLSGCGELNASFKCLLCKVFHIYLLFFSKITLVFCLIHGINQSIFYLNQAKGHTHTHTHTHAQNTMYNKRILIPFCKSSCCQPFYNKTHSSQITKIIC